MRAATFRVESVRVRASRVAAYNSPISVFGRISPYLSGIVFYPRVTSVFLNKRVQRPARPLVFRLERGIYTAAWTRIAAALVQRRQLPSFDSKRENFVRRKLPFSRKYVGKLSSRFALSGGRNIHGNATRRRRSRKFLYRYKRKCITKEKPRLSSVLKRIFA